MLKIKGEVIDVDKWYSPEEVQHISECIIKGNRRILLTDAVLLLEASNSINAKKIVELGSMDGGSSLVLGQYAKDNDGHLWCIEPFPKSRWFGNIKNAELEKYVTLKEESSPWITVETIEEILPIDVLFIDGDHRTSHVITDYIFWEKYVKVGGIIVFHDWCGQKGVRKWVREALQIILEDYKKDPMYLQGGDEKDKLELYGFSEGSDRGAIAYIKTC